MSISLEPYDYVVIKHKRIYNIVTNFPLFYKGNLEEFFKYRVFLHEDFFDDDIRNNESYLLYIKSDDKVYEFKDKDEDPRLNIYTDNKIQYAKDKIDENNVIVFRNINLPQAIEAVNGLNKLGLSFCIPKYISKMNVYNNILYIIFDD
jgi:hypothetical protein